MSQNCCAIVPVKCFAQAKTRLATLLSPLQRQKLVEDMLARVLRALTASSRVSRILVLSRERLSLPAHVQRIADGGRELNIELNDAVREARRNGAALQLVIHADLPLLSAVEVDSLVDQGSRKGIAVAPDRRNCGTNALVLKTSVPFICQFGSDSFARHCRQATEIGLQPAVVKGAGLAFDVDVAEDWQYLQDTLSRKSHEIVG